jgi:hypothetical protein
MIKKIALCVVLASGFAHADKAAPAKPVPAKPAPAKPAPAKPAPAPAPAKPVPPPPAADAKCVLTGQGDNVPFTATSKNLDKEYAAVSSGTQKGVTFYLRYGHGVARLEAWVKGKLAASTFYRTGVDPKETDSLRLAVAAKGGEAEAQCEGVDSLLPQ